MQLPRYVWTLDLSFNTAVYPLDAGSATPLRTSTHCEFGPGSERERNFAGNWTFLGALYELQETALRYGVGTEYRTQCARSRHSPALAPPRFHAQSQRAAAARPFLCTPARNPHSTASSFVTPESGARVHGACSVGNYSVQDTKAGSPTGTLRVRPPSKLRYLGFQLAPLSTSNTRFLCQTHTARRQKVSSRRLSVCPSVVGLQFDNPICPG